MKAFPLFSKIVIAGLLLFCSLASFAYQQKRNAPIQQFGASFNKMLQQQRKEAERIARKQKKEVEQAMRQQRRAEEQRIKAQRRAEKESERQRQLYLQQVEKQKQEMQRRLVQQNQQAERQVGRSVAQSPYASTQPSNTNRNKDCNETKPKKKGIASSLADVYCIAIGVLLFLGLFGYRGVSKSKKREKVRIPSGFNSGVTAEEGDWAGSYKVGNREYMDLSDGTTVERVGYDTWQDVKDNTREYEHRGGVMVRVK